MPDATQPRRRDPPDLKGLPDHKAPRITIEIAIETRIELDKIRADRIRLHLVQTESIAMQIGAASETKIQVWRSDGTLGNRPHA